MPLPATYVAKRRFELQQLIQQIDQQTGMLLAQRNLAQGAMLELADVEAAMSADAASAPTLEPNAA